MITIQGTDRLRKRTVNIDSVNLQIKAGEKFTISDADYTNGDVQSALRLGFIATVETKADPTSSKPGEVRNVVCESCHNREITFSDLDRTVYPNQQFTIPEADLKNPSIKSALRKEMIKVINTVNAGDVTEGFLKIGKDFQEKQSGMVEEREKEAADFARMFDIEEEEEQEELETNDEISGPTEVIDTEDPKTIKANDIPDAKRQSVTWNPTGRKVVNEMKNATIGRKKKKKDEESSSFVEEEDVDEILFADKELEKEKIESHPNLKSKDRDEDEDEIDFV